MAANETQWEDLALIPELVRGIREIGFEHPWAMQRDAVMTILQGHDVILNKAAGTGKSSAFIISALQKLDVYNNQCQVLILVETRESAIRMHEAILALGAFMKTFKCCKCVVIPKFRELVVSELESGCQIVVGTTGRVLDMILRGVLKVDSVKMFVVDEINGLIWRGYKEMIIDVFHKLPSMKQVVAVEPARIYDLIDEIMNDPIRIT